MYFFNGERGQKDPINIGFGEEITIKELALLICQVVGFDGELVLDKSKPDGMPRKLLDTSRLQLLGWKPGISLEDGLAKTYKWYLKQYINSGNKNNI